MCLKRKILMNYILNIYINQLDILMLWLTSSPFFSVVTLFIVVIRAWSIYQLADKNQPIRAFLWYIVETKQYLLTLFILFSSCMYLVSFITIYLLDIKKKNHVNMCEVSSERIQLSPFWILVVSILNPVCPCGALMTH